LLEVFCRASKIGNTSITFEYAVVLVKDGVELATATQVMVNVDLAARRPCAVPDRVRSKIQAFEHAL